MKDRNTPLPIVRKMDKYVPYNVIDKLKADNTSIAPGWPNFCDIPLEFNLMGILISRGLDTESAVCASTLITACYMWRENKVVYSFDEDLSRMLAMQADDLKDTDILPAELLMHPPYPCTFIKTNAIPPFGGFWYWVGYDTSANAPQLHIEFVTADMEGSAPRVLTLLPGKTILECYTISKQDSVKCVSPQNIKGISNQDRGILDILLKALQFILYISSENADIQDVPSKTVTKVRKKRNRTLDKASELTEKAVGVRIGNAIRKGRSFAHSPSRDTPAFTVRPHSRRGHWHHYWVGPKDGDRTLILKWTAPTFIHQDAFQNDTVVIFPVKQ